MSCLIIKNDGIGDLILASGLISEVGRYFGGNVDLVTCSANQEIAEGIELLRKRFYVSRDDLRFFAWPARMGVLLPRVIRQDREVLRRIKSERYDVAICLRRFIRQNSLVLMRHVRAQHRYCAWQFPTNLSQELAVKASCGWEHYDGPSNMLSEAGYNQDFLRHVVGVTINPRPRLSFCQYQANSPVTQRVALGLGGSSSTWPQHYWYELAQRLSKEGWRLLLLGGENTVELADRIQYVVPEAENRVGRLDWHGTAAALDGCVAYVGNDTGLSHFASLIVRKCLVILGGGTFRRFFPWPVGCNQHIVYHGLDCFDCGWQCKYLHKRCLSLIHPEAAFTSFTRLIETMICGETDLNSNNGHYQLAWRSGNFCKTLAIR